MLVSGSDGRARVLDFGIARASGTDESPPESGVLPAEAARVLQSGSGSGSLSDPLTRTGALMGTPAYMSPEQFSGLSVDARTDQFSLCVALYEGLYGERPFAGDSVSTLMTSVLNGAICPAPEGTEIPSWLRSVLVRGLSLEPDERYPSIEALIEALQHDPDALRRARLRLLGIVAAMIGVVALLGGLAIAQTRTARVAEQRRAQAVRDETAAQEREELAQEERDAAFKRATAAARRSRNISRLLVAENLRVDDPTTAHALLREIEAPEQTPGFVTAALNALQQPVARVVHAGHTDRVLEVAFSPDDRWVASASGDGTVRIFSSDGNGETTVLRDHTDHVRTVEFSPDGALLVTASRDKTARVWRIAEGRVLGAPLVLQEHTDQLWRATFDPAGRRIVTSARDGTARVWELSPDGAVVERSTELRGHTASVWFAEFSPDGRRLVTSGSDGIVRVWDLARPEEPIPLKGHERLVLTAHFSPDGRRVVTSSHDGTARVFTLDGDR